jgi:hypothetical protein
MTTLEGLGVALGAVSIALAIVAIWQAMYFFSKGKTTESTVTTALAEIKAQTAALERLAGRQLDRFTKAATQERHPEEVILTVARILSVVTPPAPAPTPSAGDARALREELIACYIYILYLAGLSNVILAAGLRQTEPVEDGYAEVSALTEQTFVMFRHMQGILSKIDTAELDANSNAALLRETTNDIAPQVANTAMVVQQKQQAAP